MPRMSTPGEQKEPAELELYAVTEAGPFELAAPAGVREVNDAFDHLPLGIYEGLRTFEHTKFIGLTEHLDRADRSAAGLGWDFRLDRGLLCRSLHEVVSAYPAPDMRVRFDVLSRPIPAGAAASRTVIALAPHTEMPESLLRKGVRVRVVPALRRPRPLIKTADFVVERRVFPTPGPDAFENVLVSADGELLEGASSSFFFVKNGELRTAGTDVLEGVTRGFVLALARSLGMKVRETAVRLADVHELEEAFLTSSTRGVVPVVGLDGAVIGDGVIGDGIIGDGAPGPMTNQLRKTYADFVAQNARPALP